MLIKADQPDKLLYLFAAYTLSLIAGMQVIAWYLHINGQVFALTSLVVGGIVGAIFGFKKAAK